MPKSKISSAVIGDRLRPHLAAIWRYGFSLSARPDVADDLVQATCLRAMERAHQFDPDSNILAWSLTICRSIWLNEVRASTIRNHKSLDGEAGLQLADLRPDIETNIFASQVFTQVMQLPHAQRETVMLVCVEGFTYNEASRILDIPIGTVMSRLSSARGRLRRLTDDKDEPVKQMKT